MPPASTPLAAPSAQTAHSHPLYTRWLREWTRLHDVFEGAGGFLDEARPYLVAHPREWLDHSIPIQENGVTIRYDVNPNPRIPSPKLKERRKLARYENYAATLIDQLAGALFRESATRTFEQPSTDRIQKPIEVWWKDADGMGNAWDDVLRLAWRPCAAFGHLWLYMDVDENGLPVVRLYTPLDVPDWLTDDRGRIAAVRFKEAAPRDDFAKAATFTQAQYRLRTITPEGWTLTDAKGGIIDQGAHDYDGVLPVTIWYAKRRALTPMLGRSVLGDPQLYIDLYNLISETRELLRKTAFAVINVPVGENGNLDQAQQMLGRQTGAGNILFTPAAAQLLESDGASVSAYHEHTDRLIRVIYRLSVVAWDSDSRDAESADSRRIKREDLNQQLAAFADECRRVDEWATDMVYRIAYGSSWEGWRKNDGLTIDWPDSFDVTPLVDLAAQFSEAIALDLGETAVKTLKKRAARAVLPDTHENTLAAIDADIDQMEVLTEEDRRQQDLEARTARMSEAFGG